MTITEYSDVNRDQHREFASRMWPKKRRRCEERYIRWKFRNIQGGPTPGLLLAVDNGRVLGQLGVIPATLRTGSVTHSCQWACDLMVDPAVRGHGVGSALLGEAMRRPCITLGSNPSQAADIVMSRVGFQVMCGSKVMVLPLDLRHAVSWKVPQSLRALIPCLTWLGGPLVRHRMSTLVRFSGGPSLEFCPWEEVVPLIEQRQAALGHPHIVHDRPFLEWRCGGLEGFSEALVAVRAGSGGYAIVGPAQPYFYVYEWSAACQAECLSLFQGIHKRATDCECQTIMVTAQNATEERWLKGGGFFAMRRPVKLMHYPGDVLSGESQFVYCLYDSDGNL